MTNKKKIIDFWDAVALKDKHSAEMNVGMLGHGNTLQNHFRAESEWQFFNSLFGSLNGKRVLEVGVGGGRWAFELASKGAQVVGIDISQKMIDICNQVLSKWTSGNQKVEFHCCDLHTYLATCTEDFDLIYFSGVLMYLSDEDVTRDLQLAGSRTTDGGCVLARETINEKYREDVNGDYVAIYRTLEEYKTLVFEATGKNPSHALAYQKLRFSNSISKLRFPTIFGIEGAERFRKLLVSVNDLLGDPEILKSKIYKISTEKYGEKVHIFLAIL